MERKIYFTAEFFQFLRELKENNDRVWFQENKQRYEEQVRIPALTFIAEFAIPLHQISPHFVADPRPHGGSMFRIYRDTRFSRDKSPYKTHVGIHFRHELAKDAHAPAFYLHLEPGEVLAAAGIWHPDGKTLSQIRDAIAANPDAWRQAISFPDPDIRLGGDSLKRPPRGYDPDHPLIEDLKRKDFFALTYFSEEAALKPGFMQKFATACETMASLNRFLCQALTLPW